MLQLRKTNNSFFVISNLCPIANVKKKNNTGKIYGIIIPKLNPDLSLKR